MIQSKGNERIERFNQIQSNLIERITNKSISRKNKHEYLDEIANNVQCNNEHTNYFIKLKAYLIFNLDIGSMFRKVK